MLDAAVHGYAELSLTGRASLSADGHGGTLRALALRYPEARWKLEAPVRIESRPGVLAVSPFTLRTGRSVISARVLKRRAKLVRPSRRSRSVPSISASSRGSSSILRSDSAGC